MSQPSTRRNTPLSAATTLRGRRPPSKKSSKAVYEPLSSSRGRWSRVKKLTQAANAFSGSSKLALLQEAEDESISEYAPSVAPQRDNYHPPSSPRTSASIATIKQYLNNTDIEDVFSKLLKQLLALTNLPYNPYPGFVKRFRVYAEKFNLYERSSGEILKHLSTDVEGSHLAYLYHPVHCDYAYGLKNLVEILEPKVLKDYVWLFQTLAMHKSRMDHQQGYSNQTMLALVGPSVFHGPMCLAPSMITVRVEYLITGPQVSVGLELFINSIIMDLVHIETEKTHILLGVQIPKQSEDNKDIWINEYWTYEQMIDKKDNFTKMVLEAVTESRYIYAECVFRLDPRGTLYKKGQKEYALNFVQVTEAGEEQGMTYFTEFPLITLHEGVFLKRSHAEAYLSTFTSKLDLVHKKGDDKTESNESSSNNKKKKKTDKSNSEASSKVKLDGFLVGDNAPRTPDAWQVTAPIKSSWQKRVASMNTHTEIFEIVNYLLLMVIMDKEAYGIDIRVEIYRFLHSSAARLYLLMQQNQTIRELVLKFEGVETSELLDSVFLQYKHDITELFDSELQERSSDLVTCSRAMKKTLENVLNMDFGSPGSIPVERKTVEVLKNINSYCYTLLIGLVEDAIDHCPNLKELIRTFQKSFPEAIPRPHTAVRNRLNKKKTGVRAGEGEEYFVHGVEDESIMKHDSQVINIEMCVERDTAPKAIAVESVLLRYITDTHLDDMWPNILLDLTTGTCLPPNPYPRLVTACRQSALRMDLFSESPTKLTNRLVHSSARIEDQKYHVYHIPGCDAHGLQTAISMLDTGTFFELAPLVSQFIQTDFKLRQGPYRIAICCAISGFTPLYGYMDPYLNEIELHEHCYIRGPQGCWGDAMQIYSKIVYEHIKDLYNQQVHFLCWLFLGSTANRWAIEEALNRKKGFAAEFERSCENGQPIFIKMFVQMGWRLVPVVKYFKYHYMNDEETEYTLLKRDVGNSVHTYIASWQQEDMFPQNKAHLYQNVFLSKERAAFHFQYGGPPDRSNPYNSSNMRHAGHDVDSEILKTKREQNWVNVYRWLLLKNVMAQGSAIVPEAWRMLHSTARQVEYINALGKSLQELVRYMLVLESRQKDTATYYNVTSEDKEQEIKFKLETTLGQMVMAYRQKVIQICTSQCAMAPRSMVEVINTKLQSITERDEITRELFILVDIKSVFVLEEVISMMQALQDALAYDVHAVCTESHAMLKSIEAEFYSRPQSVASHQLEDHLKFVPRPPVRYVDHVNDWADF